MSWTILSMVRFKQKTREQNLEAKRLMLSGKLFQSNKHRQFRNTKIFCKNVCVDDIAFDMIWYDK